VGNRMEVLAVDDEPALVELVAASLSAAGHHVRTAADGLAALDALREMRPDVVILDVMMPELDGWGVLEGIASDRGMRDLPVVMLTALTSERDVIRAHLTGAVEYVVKPFDVPTLIAAVDHATRPVDDEERAERRARRRHFLARLAELDAGRTADGPRVRFAGLEAPRAAPAPTPVNDGGGLTPRQRLIAGMLADDVGAREIASRLGTSRSNVYATRERIARQLGVTPDEVPKVARSLRLNEPVPTPETDVEDGAD
jgi:DNA-binding response OmpR family regulator